MVPLHQLPGRLVEQQVVVVGCRSCSSLCLPGLAAPAGLQLTQYGACLPGGKGVLVWGQVLAAGWLLGKEPPAWSCSAGSSSGGSKRGSKSLKASAENTGSPMSTKHGIHTLLSGELC